jgi:prevent-host-death family protein
MRDTYSLYETKARFSAIIRQVREGQRVIVTLHGTPVAEIRPVYTAAGGLAERIAELTDRGVLHQPTTSKPTRFRTVARRPGAVKRFLAERDE